MFKIADQRTHFSAYPRATVSLMAWKYWRKSKRREGSEEKFEGE